MYGKGMYISESRMCHFIFDFQAKRLERKDKNTEFFILPLTADTLYYVNCIPAALARG